MKTPDDNETSALRSVLKEWKLNTALPPRFDERVWKRIERVEAAQRLPLKTLFAQWLARTFARPAVAVAYVAVLLLVGTSVGAFHAQHQQSRMHEELASRYVQSLDPYQNVASR